MRGIALWLAYLLGSLAVLALVGISWKGLLIALVVGARWLVTALLLVAAARDPNVARTVWYGGPLEGIVGLGLVGVVLLGPGVATWLQTAVRLSLLVLFVRFVVAGLPTRSARAWAWWLWVTVREVLAVGLLVTALAWLLGLADWP